MSFIDIKDLAGLSEPVKRVIDCLDKGISTIASPFAYKRMERARLRIEQEHSDQKAVIALKEAMTQDMIEVARTSRDRNELHNIAEIYSGAIRELHSIDPSKLPVDFPSNDWAAHFYDCAKDCSDDEIRTLWSKILAGEIKEPGQYYKRTLTNLHLLERHEAEWFVDICKYSIDDCFLPEFVISDNIFPFHQYQSLVDCGFINSGRALVEFHCDRALKLKTGSIKIESTKDIYEMPVFTLTDSGIQICSLVDVDADPSFVDRLVESINGNGTATATATYSAEAKGVERDF